MKFSEPLAQQITANAYVKTFIKTKNWILSESAVCAQLFLWIKLDL